MTTAERLAAIERRLDIVEGKLVPSLGVNPSGMMYLRAGSKIESAYDYAAKATDRFDPPVPVEKSGWYTAHVSSGELSLKFYGAN